MDLLKNNVITEKIRCQEIVDKYINGTRDEQLLAFSIEQSIERADKAIDSEGHDEMNTALSLLKNIKAPI